MLYDYNTLTLGGLIGLGVGIGGAWIIGIAALIIALIK